MTRGSLGTLNINQMIQETANPEGQGTPQLKSGERIFRVGDRVIHRRNNYDLNVFNGDIGVIQGHRHRELTCMVAFFPDNRQVLYQGRYRGTGSRLCHHHSQIPGQRI